MPIRPPALDDRRFDDLVAELVARIPAHTPEWTNPRVGDPGRTLIDLFAWLGDALLYRANLIPERQRLAFLRLLGQPMRPAQPARGLVTVALKDGKPPAVFPFRPGASLPGPLPFEAPDEFTALPVTGAAFFKRLPTADDGVADDLEQALATVHNNGAPVQLYLTAPLFAGGQPEPGGFDVFGASCDRALWVALFAPKAPDPAQQPAFNTQTVALLGATGTGSRQLLNVGLAPALPPSAAGSATNPFDIVPDLPAGRWASTSVRAQIPHLWEITVNTSGQPVTHQNPWKPEYLALDEAVDTTQGLTRSGIVRLLLPRSALLHAPANDVREDLNAGVGDRPPRLDDTGLASRLVAWLRLRPRPPQTPAPADGAFAPTSGDANGHTGSPATSGSTPPHLRLTWLGVNTVSLEQLTTRAGIVVGTSAGTADQSFPLPAGSVEPATFALSVEETSGWVPWQRVDDLAALDRDALAARDARAFELDPEAGTVRFGDGIRGRLPPAGARILAVEMRSGGGQAGNLAAGSLKTIAGTTQTGAIAGSDLVVAQPLPLTGGADAETLAEAEKRIPALFRHRDRAVTEDDYRTLAALTPGVAVGRVELLPRFKPQQRTPDVPGVVSVLVLPGVPLGPAPNPRADRPFLEENPHPLRVVAEPLPPLVGADEHAIAIACSSEGRLALLTWRNNSALLRLRATDGSWQEPDELPDAGLPASLAWLAPARLAGLPAIQPPANAADEAIAFDLEFDAETRRDRPAPGGGYYPLRNPGLRLFAQGPVSPPRYPTADGGLKPLLSLSVAAYAEAGAAVSRVLDAGADGTVWHRIYLEASIPPDCGIDLDLAATDDPSAAPAPADWFRHRFGDLPDAADTAPLPRGVWLRDRSELPHHDGLLGTTPEPRRHGLFTVLVQRTGRRVRSLSGRYLHLRATLTGTGHSTPEIAAVRIYGPRFSYRDHYLPELYREDLFGADADAAGPAAQADFLDRFLGLFESVLTPLEDRVAQAQVLMDPRSAPAEALEWLGSWIGVVFDPAFPVARRRAWLGAAHRLFLTRGTLAGLQLAIEIATGGRLVHATIDGRDTEYPDGGDASTGRALVIEDFRLRRTSATILGADLSEPDDPLLPGLLFSTNSLVGDTLLLGDEQKREFLALFRHLTRLEGAAADLYDRLAHRATVLVHDQVTPVDFGLLRRLVAQQAPAHVQVRVERATWPLLVGLASLVGVDTFLTPPRPRDVAVVGDQPGAGARLGENAFVQRAPALDPRLIF